MFNPTNADAYVDIYEFTCIENTDTGPKALWEQHYLGVNEGDMQNDNPANASTAAQLTNGIMNTNQATTAGIDRIGEKPCGKALWKYWKQTGHVATRIQTARSLTYTHGTYDFKIAHHALQDSGNPYLKGISKALIVVFRGETIQNNQTVPDTTTYISTSDITLLRRHQQNWIYHSWETYDTTKKVIMTLSTAENGDNNWGLARIPQANQVFENTETDNGAAGFDATDYT